MDRLEFNKVLDEYLCTGNMNSEDYYKMDSFQQYTIQQIKKAFKRMSKDALCEPL